MSLRISTTPALIGINRIPGKLDIQQPMVEMELNIEHPRVEIDTEPARVQIDQSQCFAEAGLKNFLDLTTDNAAYARQKSLEGIERVVRQGNELAAIHIEGNPIADQAEENSVFWNNREFNFDLIPKSRPKIDSIGGTVDVKLIEGKIDPQVKAQKPIINFTPGNVEIYLRQKNSIQIEYIGNKLDVNA
ncbi:DUF6470 family protein [Anaerosolibacter sp.]|uniref:DUF6470 family protein n=1 Tax=Anaerosolibacter sp. TaxID=1872527 RepID=UPI0039EE487A